MRTTFLCVDVVGEGIKHLRIAVVPLQCDLGVDAISLPPHVDRLGVDGVPILVEELHERVDPAFIAKIVALAVPFVIEGDPHTRVQKRELPQSLRERVEAVVDRLEHLRVRLECQLGATTCRRAGDRQVSIWHSAHVALLIDLAVAPDLQLKRFRQCIDNGDTNTMQPTRDLVALIVELPPGMQHRQHDLGRWPAAGMQINRNSPPVVHHRDRAINMNRDLDRVAEPGERLVDRIVDRLVDQVMQAGRTGGPDIHRRPFTYRFEPFQDLDLVRAVVLEISLGDDRCFSGDPDLHLARRRRIRIDLLLLLQLRHVYVFSCLSFR